MPQDAALHSRGLFPIPHDEADPGPPWTLVVLPEAEGLQGHVAQPAEAEAVGAGCGIGKRPRLSSAASWGTH